MYFPLGISLIITIKNIAFLKVAFRVAWPKMKFKVHLHQKGVGICIVKGDLPVPRKGLG